MTAPATIPRGPALARLTAYCPRCERTRAIRDEGERYSYRYPTILAGRVICPIGTYVTVVAMLCGHRASVVRFDRKRAA